MYKTKWTKKEEIERKWYIIDAKDQILGRLSTVVAELLMGKKKSNYVPNIDCGDYVIVINSSEIKLTRDKENKKMYYRHSGYMGGLKEIKFAEMKKSNPNFIIERAVKLMLPDNKLRTDRINRLFVYSGTEHNQKAQKPEEIKL